MDSNSWRTLMHKKIMNNTMFYTQMMVKMDLMVKIDLMVKMDLTMSHIVNIYILLTFH